MQLSLVTPPAVPLLSLAEAKEHLRVDGSDSDNVITAYVETAREMLDAQWGELGLALTTQTWKLTLPAFQQVLEIPLAPVQSVSSVTYFDSDNAEQTLSSSLYRVTIQTDGARIDLVENASFPSTFNRVDAVAVQFVAGFGDTAADVPEGIRNAARLMVGHWYESREAVTEKSMSALPIGVRSLLMKFRVVRGHI